MKKNIYSNLEIYESDTNTYNENINTQKYTEEEFDEEYADEEYAEEYAEDEEEYVEDEEEYVEEEYVEEVYNEEEYAEEVYNEEKYKKNEYNDNNKDNLNMNNKKFYGRIIKLNDEDKNLLNKKNIKKFIKNNKINNFFDKKQIKYGKKYYTKKKYLCHSTSQSTSPSTSTSPSKYNTEQSTSTSTSSSPSKYFTKTNNSFRNYVYDEYLNLPKTILEAFNNKKNLTLKQIIIIMNLNGLSGEMLNIIHDNLQFKKKIKKYRIKIDFSSKPLYVSMYSWYNLLKIENYILEMFDN
jgi:hypothetical protein